ncbi:MULTISPECIES: PhoH family protein [unclassified Butyrivibrio]|uniref:PhoH family protein n=1 Tax=unclassified Butyrivibrio TaxID=2639466 RepID=UPI0003B795FE|nr:MULTISPECIES: PhoH family protein [unclassified Butyrivibrio]SDB28582.1 PhoH-like ATPase [Butyrivibrio sp. INlla16]SEL06170.1 PhoH-like ATPase [Butyrivibrio sp. ob235]
MKKIYVLDTNVLIQAPHALRCFDDNDVVLPLVVLEELDTHKRDEGERGANVREVIRLLEELRKEGDLTKGVELQDGAILRVEKNYKDVELPKDMVEYKSDNRILRVCKGLSDTHKEQVILVTKDILMRIKAQLLGIQAQDFTTEQVVSGDDQYAGRIRVYAPEENFKEFRRKGVPVDVVYICDENGDKIKPELYENEFVVLQSDQSTNKTQMGRVDHGVIRKLEFEKAQPYGVTPRNAGQYFLQEALMQPADKAPLVIVKGMAGTAKTFYSLAVGLEKMINRPTGEYRRILVCRPNSQFDDDIGFLPGDEQEKIGPLMRPIIDNLEQLIDSSEEERYNDEKELQDKTDEIFERGIVQTEALNFIRGRSILKTYLIIDEAQNMTPAQAKGIITRAGKDTKIILLGDPNQIDRPFLDERTNGLSYASEHMKGSELCWQITLSTEECERSRLAMDAIGRMRDKVIL